MILRWWEAVRNLCYDVCEFVVRLWHYLPIIWQDRDYDWMYALHLLRFKLSRISDYLGRSRWSSVESKRTTRQQIRAINTLMQRIADEDYLKKEWRVHFKKYPTKFERIEGSQSSRITPYTKAGRRSSHSLRTRSDRMLERDWNQLWQLLNKQMRNWWD